MGALIGWELKKITSRKALWVALVLGLALMLWIDLPVMHDGASGLAQGWHDIYAQYEGQIVTDAFRQQAQSDFDKYIARHADQYEAWPSGEDGTVHYFGRDFGYYYGAGNAFDRLIQTSTLEEEQKQFADAEQYLKSGTWESGKPLDAISRRYFERYVHRGLQTPFVHDAKGWEDYLNTGKSSLPGMVAMILSALALLGTFNGEASARMEAVVLTTKARRRLAAAKLLSGGGAACAVAVLFLALHVGVFAWAYGLDGAELPAGQVFYHYANNLTVLQAFMLSNVATLLAVLACVAVTTWASAQFRHPILSLMVAGVVLGAMTGAQGFLSIIDNFSNTALPTLLYRVSEYAFLLPASALYNHYTVFYGMEEPLKLAFLLACPVVLTALLCWLAQHTFLRRRRV